jgi:hypothetical protein
VVGLGALFLDGQTAGAFLHDGDGSMRVALVCWAIAVSAFVILKVPRQVLLACLLVGTVTVGFAALLADTTPDEATASAAEPARQPSPASYRSVPPRSAASHVEHPR